MTDDSDWETAAANPINVPEDSEVCKVQLSPQVLPLSLHPFAPSVSSAGCADAESKCRECYYHISVYFIYASNVAGRGQLVRGRIFE